jgi:hypothetical protein
VYQWHRYAPVVGLAAVVVVQFRSESLVSVVRDALHESGLAPEWRRRSVRRVTATR